MKTSAIETVDGKLTVTIWPETKKEIAAVQAHLVEHGSGMDTDYKGDGVRFDLTNLIDNMAPMELVPLPPKGTKNSSNAPTTDPPPEG